MKTRTLVTLALFALLLAGCGNLLDPAAAVVNGDKITVDQVEAAVSRFEESPEFDRLAQQGDRNELLREVEQQELSRRIRRAVLMPIASERGVEVTDDDVAQRIEDIKAELPSEGAFEEALREQGLTLEQLEELVFDNLVEERLREEVTADAAPTDAEVRAAYEEQKDQYEETDVQHILVEDRELAATLAQQLDAAPPNKVDDLFAQLAKENSIDESNANDAGSLGTLRPADAANLAPPFRRAMEALDEGEISPPVKTQFGFHVIRVTDRRTAPLSEVRDEIEAAIGQAAQDEAWQNFLMETFDEAEIKVNPRYGEFDPESLAVVDARAQDVPGAEEAETPQPGGTEAPQPGTTEAPQE